MEERLSLSEKAQSWTTAPHLRLHRGPSGDVQAMPEPSGIDAVLALGPDDKSTPHWRKNEARRPSVTKISTLPIPAEAAQSSSGNLTNGMGGAAEKINGRRYLTYHARAEQQVQRRRKYTMFESPQTTWFCGGHLMTGGDSMFSVVLTVLILLGLTVVWLGTTGAWLWVHGTEYGLAKRGGVAIVIVFV